MTEKKSNLVTIQCIVYIICITYSNTIMIVLYYTSEDKKFNPKIVEKKVIHSNTWRMEIAIAVTRLA